LKILRYDVYEFADNPYLIYSVY